MFLRDGRLFVCDVNKVVVYDRMRENLRSLRKRPLREVIDLSINQTIVRTSLTQFTILLALFPLVFFGGEPSHAFTKAPMLAEEGYPAELDPSGTFAVEQLAAADPDPRVWDFGAGVLAAAVAHLGIAVGDLLYARVDLIGGAEDATLLELELVEPSLGWAVQSPAVRAAGERRFAMAVESALQRLGLGPMSHRPPKF